MSVGQELWVVATGASAGDGGKLLSNLQSKAELNQKGGVLASPVLFKVPTKLLFGSFDSLVRLTDDLQKFDTQCDSIVHRFERQFLELDPANAKFMVKHQRKEMDLSEYLKSWEWDNSKYSPSLQISDLLTLLSSVVNKLDEEARIKTAQYNDVKSQKSNLAKKEGANLLSRDLVDVLTPEQVNMKSREGTEHDDFIYTEHLTTVVVILPRGTQPEFLKSYESMNENVIPQSAKHFKALDDKDGNSVWRVVVFKSEADSFKKVLRERRMVPRDFEYSEEAFRSLQAQRQKVDKEVDDHFRVVKSLYKAAWSDTVVSWVHLKAMRIYVESVLRYGMPPQFASFIVPPKLSAMPAARKQLASILGQGQPGANQGDAGDDEEFFPYVSVSMTPFTIARG